MAINVNDFLELQEASVLVSWVVANKKQDCHNIIASKLNNPRTSAKAYCLILKHFTMVKNIQLFLHS